MVIKNFVQATCLSLITVYTVLDVFGCISSKMVSLALHRPDSGIEEEELETGMGQPYDHRQRQQKVNHTQLFIS